MVGLATVGRLIVREKEVVLVMPAPTAVTVTVAVPAGVEPLVLMVSVEVQAGLQEPDEKEAVAPVGKPAAEKLTA